MHLLFIDDEDAWQIRMKLALSRLEHTVIVKPNGEQALALSDEQLEKVDVAIIDQQLPGGLDGMKVGRRLKQRRPDLILMMLTAYGSVDILTELLRGGIFRDFIAKPFSDKTLETALLRVEPEIALRREHERLKHQVISQQASSSQFLDLTRHLLGVNNVLLDIERHVVKPFADWLSGKRDLEDKDLRPKFITHLLLEGEPGSGKTVICKAIAKTFECEDAVLDQDMAPTDNPGRWKEPLNRKIREYYALARERRMVVIRADDLVWTDVRKISDAGLSADWNTYMNTLRAYLEDAGSINEGRPPKNRVVRELVRDVGRSFEGKILWLFARNTEEDVGPMFAPLRSLMKGLPLNFPRKAEDRELILKTYAESQGWVFDPNALELAVRETQNYSGRDLVGDENSNKGFVKMVIEYVKRRERELSEKTKGRRIDRRIKISEVEEWLDGPDHELIMKQVEANPDAYVRPPEETDRKYYLDGLDSVRADLDIVEMLLRKKKAPADIGEALYGSVKTPAVYFNNFLRNTATKDAFAKTPEQEAKDRWPRLIDHIIHKHPKLAKGYPKYITDQ